MPETLTAANLPGFADRLARKDPVLRAILLKHGPPPVWKRPANFETLVRIVLEQQVSLSSAKATLERLRTLLDGRIVAKRLIATSDQQLRDIGFSRQKNRYCRSLGQAVVSRSFSIAALRTLSDDEVRSRITALVGFGDWSADIYLMMALGRLDILPTGDLGLVQGLAEAAGREFGNKQAVIDRAEKWRPHRSVATRMIWQEYLHNRGKDPQKMSQ